MRGRSAAGGGMWAIAGWLLLLLALGCGDERPPWSGFELFPPDASLPELSPDLQARLAAAAAAFVAQPAAGQSAPPMQAAPTDAGVEEPPRMAAESDGHPEDSASSGYPEKPMMHDAGAEMEPPARQGAAGARGFPTRWPFELDASVTPWFPRRDASTGMGDQADADAGEPAADGGN